MLAIPMMSLSVPGGRLELLNTSTNDRSGLQMSLPARAENVAVVRHALAGLAERLGMDEASLADLKTVVTEACMNVVVHAYAGNDPGPIEVEAESDLDGLTVVIRDHGSGIRPRPEADRPSLRIGLTLIAALSSSFEIKGGADKGTEIRMHLPLQAREEGAKIGSTFSVTADEETRIRVGPPEIVGPVLSRALSALAARQDISVDRLSDTMLLSDAISARAPQGFTDGHVSLSIAERPEGIQLKVGPMTHGGAERLRASFELPEVGGSLEKLTDELRIEDGAEGEYLVVGISSLSTN
jgi:serine/threonine-protein kinase RsbW